MIEFEKLDATLILAYTPQNDASWVYKKFEIDKEAVIKGTFHLRREHLVTEDSAAEPSEEPDIWDPETLRFRVARLEGDYFSFDTEILHLDYVLLIHHTAKITWKWFIAEQRVSIFRTFTYLRPARIVIGGDEPDAIPEAQFEELTHSFPTRYELKRYVLARVGAVLREYSEIQADAESLYRKYVSRRLNKRTRDIVGLFRKEEERKYRYLLDRLSDMLEAENTYTEAAWQEEILQIILLLNPKYIKAIKHAPVKDSDRSVMREVDILLIDASGNIDIIEIKQPFDKCIVTAGQYRDNHIPLRELSGSVMQIEKYIYYLNRWGPTGEEVLTTKYREQLPQNFSIKITNPGGIILMGRDKSLTHAQLRDFEVVKRKYKNIVDIITYDDLLRRLNFVLRQLTEDV